MKIVGHRGARGLAPENTLSSLKKALQHKVDEIEFDVRVSKDKVAVLHHDRFLETPNGQKYLIASHTYHELVGFKKDLTTLKEALAAVAESTAMYMEVKPKEVIKPIISTIISYLSSGGQIKQLRLASFNQKTLMELHGALPQFETIVIEPWSTTRAIRRARQLKTPYISMNQQWLWGGFISAMARRGWKLYTYSLNDTDKAKRWKRHGLYAAVTDYPDRFET